MTLAVDTDCNAFFEIAFLYRDHNLCITRINLALLLFFYVIIHLLNAHNQGPTLKKVGHHPGWSFIYSAHVTSLTRKAHVQSTHELNLCIQIIGRRVDINGDSAVKILCRYWVLNLWPSDPSGSYFLSALPSPVCFF